jgi:hypothetical protein
MKKLEKYDWHWVKQSMKTTLFKSQSKWKTYLKINFYNEYLTTIMDRCHLYYYYVKGNLKFYSLYYHILDYYFRTTIGVTPDGPVLFSGSLA